jgi:hypothetical protein
MIKDRLGVQAVIKPGSRGQFEVFADGEKVAERGGNWLTRSLGAGYPDLDAIVEQLIRRRQSEGSPG